MKFIYAFCATGSVILNWATTASAALLFADSSTFANKYSGADIYDGASFQNQWVGGGSGTTNDLSLNGSNLVYSYSTNNGWLEHDGGSTPWELGLGGSWTVSVRAKLTSTDPSPYGRFVIWTDAAAAGGNQILVAGEGGVNQYGFGFDLAADNTDGFHEYRIAYDDENSAYYFFRDGDQVMQFNGVASGLADGSYAQRATTGNARLIIGDCCSNVGGVGGQVEYEWVRYDMGGAYAPDQVPEPSSLALLALGFLGLAGNRRR